ncbi:hypothetical protein [Parvularcula marina]|uniref:Uncharacterized protein n=1 Tax=Parvularcula marina TaxID=2292771 RepID=A0A371RKI5_9PROT|nr:hypothetical protein [Parvularcula marina]RFB05969.1 hypothetical protein DX908_12275 [Parvularcula marina]
MTGAIRLIIAIFVVSIGLYLYTGSKRSGATSETDTSTESVAEEIAPEEEPQASVMPIGDPEAIPADEDSMTDEAAEDIDAETPADDEDTPGPDNSNSIILPDEEPTGSAPGR